MKVYFSLSPDKIDVSNGVGQVVEAQFRHLPAMGVDIVNNPDTADLVTCHITKGGLKQVDILMCHGLYWEDIPHLPFRNWHYSANQGIIEVAREARAIIVPSDWVAEPFRRDMRVKPVVIGHGVNCAEWKRAKDLGYILYNKNRESDVCSSEWAFGLAERGFPVTSTFHPHKLKPPANMQILDSLPFEKMKKVIESAHIYLATTLETFGIGTVEALACGVPVLGFDWGGTADIVRHKIDGYLVPYGDIDALVKGITYIEEHYAELSKNALARSKEYDWVNIMRQYKDLFDKVYAEKKAEVDGVSIIITNYNYGKYLPEAIDSCLFQDEPVKEIIVVDDGSKDNSRDIIKAYADNPIVKPIFLVNGGVARARNIGINSAKFPYIICLDADDKIEPAFSRVLHKALKADRALGIGYTGLKVFNNEGKFMNTEWPPEFSWLVQANPSNPPSNTIPSACMFRKSMWERCGGYRQEYAPGEDAEFWVRGLSLGFTAKKVTHDKLFHYRTHPQGASRTKPYKFITAKNTWMITKRYPMGAPLDTNGVTVNSYLMPDVSVIIPVGKGHENTLPMAIESVLSQTCIKWELIVINDTGKPLDLHLYPFIRVFDNTGMHGAGVARNIGIKQAKAKFCMFLDADDYILPDMLEHVLLAEQMTPGRYVYTDYYLARGTSIEKVESKSYNQMDWKMQNPVTVLMETSKAKELLFDESLVSWEDWDFFTRCAIIGYCGTRLPEPLLVYQLDAGFRRAKMLDENGELSNDGKIIIRNMREKYAPYYTGDKIMSGCCGGGGQTIIKAKETLNMLPKATPNEYPDRVRMEYVGANFGAISLTVNGHVYRGGLNPSDKFVDALKDDVKTLLDTGRWKAVSPVYSPPEERKVTAGVTDAEVIAIAQDTLMQAKADMSLGDLPDLEDFLNSQPVVVDEPEVKEDKPEVTVKQKYPLKKGAKRETTVHGE